MASWRGLSASSKRLPPDIKIQTTRDQSLFIRRSFTEIQHHLVLGGLLASIVVLLFMRNFRTTIIAAVAIPASIIGTFTLMKAFGFTMNNMTMLALSLATGIVIDDAIVVLENIFRYVEEKKLLPREAASKATSEIGLAVMATTLVSGRNISARRIHDRTDRAIFLQLRHRFGFGVPDFDVHFVHLDPGALRHLAAIHRCAPHKPQNPAAFTSPSTARMERCSAGACGTARLSS